jgi:putative endonuclease
MEDSLRYFLYILVCHDDTLFTGITTNLAKTLEEARSGKNPYVASRLPCCLVYTETHKSKWAAWKREQQIRNMSQTRKLQVIRRAMDQDRLSA